MAYPIPPWLEQQRADPSGEFIRAFQAGAQISEAQARMDQSAQQTGLELALRQQTLQEESARRSQELAMTKAYHDATIGVRKQQLAQAKEINDMKIKQAARSFAAQQTMQGLVKGGMDPIHAAIQAGIPGAFSGQALAASARMQPKAPVMPVDLGGGNFYVPQGGGRLQQLKQPEREDTPFAPIPGIPGAVGGYRGGKWTTIQPRAGGSPLEQILAERSKGAGTNAPGPVGTPVATPTVAPPKISAIKLIPSPSNAAPMGTAQQTGIVAPPTMYPPNRAVPSAAPAPPPAAESPLTPGAAFFRSLPQDSYEQAKAKSNASDRTLAILQKASSSQLAPLLKQFLPDELWLTGPGPFSIGERELKEKRDQLPAKLTDELISSGYEL
jgi:hypothetical protein